jgi:hypothetical protein
MMMKNEELRMNDDGDQDVMMVLHFELEIKMEILNRL